MFILLAIGIGLLFAMNIGASGTAAAMGAAYGGGAIRVRWKAMALVGVFSLLGAVFGGKEVVQTMGGGIVPSHLLHAEITVIILFSACSTLFVANHMGIPLSTSEVAVGAVVGAGIALKMLYINHLLLIMGTWLALPFAAFAISYVLGKGVPRLEKKLNTLPQQGKVKKGLTLLLVGAGCYEAFSAGMNNVANAVGPLVGADLLDVHTGVWLGGSFVAIGALALGGKVLETNGTKLTRLSLIRAFMVSVTSGTLVLIASVFGLPVPLTQATTLAIVGVGTADHGFSVWKGHQVFRKVIKVWIVSPLASLMISYALIQTMWLENLYLRVGLMSGWIIGVIAYIFSKMLPGILNTALSYDHPERKPMAKAGTIPSSGK